MELSKSTQPRSKTRWDTLYNICHCAGFQGRPALPALDAQVEEGLRGHRAVRRRLHRRGAHQPAPRSQARIAGGTHAHD